MENSRFGLLEVDGVTAAPLPAPETPLVVLGETVDESEKARVIADAQLAEGAGFAVCETVVPIGTLVTQGGQERFSSSRRDWEALPTVDMSVSSLCAQVSAEERQDISCDASMIHMGNDRALIKGADRFALTMRGIKSLADRATDGMGYYAGKLFESDSDCAGLLADNLNFHLGRSWEEKKGQRVFSEMKLRTRIHANGGREVFAAVGPRYTAHDIDAIARQVSGVVASKGQTDARCEVKYDGYKSTMDVLFHSNIQASKVVAGEYFKAGIRVRTADDGTGAIHVSAMVWRNLCRNLIIVDKAVRNLKSRRHVGDLDRVESEVACGIDRALDAISVFSDRWNEANLDNLMERYGVGEPQEIFKRLVANKVVWVANLRAEELTDRLMGAYATEPGISKASFINAITKSAHSYSWEKGAETSEALEETAGQLLFARTWDMRTPEAML